MDIHIKYKTVQDARLARNNRVNVNDKNEVFVGYSDGTTALAGVIKTVKGDKGDSNVFIGTMDEYKTTSSNGKIANGSLVVITSEK